MIDPIAIPLSLFSILVSLISLLFVFWQTKLLRRTIEAQTFINVMNRAEELNISQTLTFLRSLKYAKYDTFKKRATKEQKSQVLRLANFFNELSHLMRIAYVDERYLTRLFHDAWLTCAKQLLPWWIEGMRQEAGSRFPFQNFQWLCEYALYLDDEWKSTKGVKKKQFPKITYRKYLESRNISTI